MMGKREELLGLLRDALGEREYRKAVDEVGEDGLIFIVTKVVADKEGWSDDSTAEVLMHIYGIQGGSSGSSRRTTSTSSSGGCLLAVFGLIAGCIGVSVVLPGVTTGVRYLLGIIGAG